MLKILQLTDDFHDTNNDLIEAINDKNRGYGIVTITLNNLIFGIPLRSNITHRYSLVLDEVNRRGKRSSRGLDFTKAVLIRTDAEMGEVFLIPENQKKVLISKEKVLINQFTKYVNNYIRAVETNAQSTLRSPAYKYSTLVNYHDEFGI
ncbi:hypothetical protein HC725_16185 [Vibrio sp. S17_S38]|uniref:type III toxin-antitoxin system TenpIN family toxin n=1 Tax=Vibrio sp. S17_S38 TaxID=2720229 RepID=UPI001680AE28|nr:hypothetical protein [Vibrio sp. S17_S38]MBD1574789.1 hypothetical protein [Vibrio sp. S17_S38]